MRRDIGAIVPCHSEWTEKCWECGLYVCSTHIAKSPKRQGWRVCATCMPEHLSAPFVWRANIKTAGHSDPYKFAIDHSVYGVGWSVDGGVSGMTWIAYANAARREHGDTKSWESAMRFLDGLLAPNDFIWTRDNDGQFWMGRVLGEWRYDQSGTEADVVNVVDCKWMKVSDGDVLGAVMICRGLYRFVNNSQVLEYCQKLWDPKYQSVFGTKRSEGWLFPLLTSSACEDLVGFYLQQKGYSVIPSSCKASARKYEFCMTHRETGEEALVQVKNGIECLDRSEYKREGKRVFLFTSSGNYTGEENDLVEAIIPLQLSSFALEYRNQLPGSIRRWIE
jgi:hypothetical protein